MYSGRGFFYFRKGRFFTNRIPYMRWSQAWVFHALTEYLLARKEGNSMIASTVRQTEVLGVPITCFHSYDHAVETIVRRIQEGEKTFCIAINPEKVCFSHSDATFASVIRRGHVHVCDGAGTCAAVRFLKGWQIPRITGVKLFFALLQAAEDADLRVFLYGAKPETNDAAYETLRREHPRLQIAGRLHGYHKDDNEIIKQINASGAHMLFVALGSPRQERWLGEHLDMIDVPFCMGVGGSLDILSGRVKRAPEVFQRTGTEFLYRLVCEPWRWRRQSVLPGFALRALVEALSTRGLKAFTSSREILR
jgi:N-acetylglucosaminyldiphosphoundecaprenol N-acetyl-beta-D-mannosaminyltransferase